MLTQEVTHTQWTLSHTGHPSSDHRVKIPFFLHHLLWLWDVYQTLGIKSVFLIPASAQSKAHWGIWNFLCWLHSSFEVQPFGEILGSLPRDTSREKSCCIHEPMGLCNVSASRNPAQQSFPLPSYLVFENRESNSSWVLYGHQGVLRNPGEWIPSRKGSAARNCLWQHSQLLSHTAGWHPVCRGTVSALPCPFLSHSLSKDWNWTFLEAMD